MGYSKLKWKNIGGIFIAILHKADLKDTVKKCSCCERKLYASTSNLKETQFGSFQNKVGWYYYAWCKECFREKAKLRKKGYSSKEANQRMKLRRAEEKAARQWTIYKFTLDITKLDDRVKKKYRKIHNLYHYIGITKQEPKDRWNEHLYSLKFGEHHNYFLNSIYGNVRKLYAEMSDYEFFNLFKDDIIKFEVLSKLDKDLTEVEVKIYEAFEVKRLEFQLRLTDKEKFISTLETKKKDKDLCLTSNEMICNIEHSIINARVKKEIDKMKKA